MLDHLSQLMPSALNQLPGFYSLLSFIGQTSPTTIEPDCMTVDQWVELKGISKTHEYDFQETFPEHHFECVDGVDFQTISQVSSDALHPSKTLSNGETIRHISSDKSKILFQYDKTNQPIEALETNIDSTHNGHQYKEEPNTIAKNSNRDILKIQSLDVDNHNDSIFTTVLKNFSLVLGFNGFCGVALTLLIPKLISCCRHTTLELEIDDDDYLTEIHMYSTLVNNGTGQNQSEQRVENAEQVTPAFTSYIQQNFAEEQYLNNFIHSSSLDDHRDDNAQWSSDEAPGPF